MLSSPTCKYLSGSVVAMVTPFMKDGQVDFGAFRELIALQAGQGTNSLFFLGTAGEKAVLSASEWEAVVRKTALFPRQGMKFVYGCTGTDTASTINNVRIAAEYGADAAFISVPPYHVLSAENSRRYFLDVADDGGLPIGIYNNPARLITDVGDNSPEYILSHPNIKFYKEGGDKTGSISKILASDCDVAVLSSDSVEFDITSPTLALGGDGICNSVGNILPRLAARLAKPWRSYEDVLEYRRIYLDVFPLLQFLYSYTSPIALKSLMFSMDLPVGYSRAPSHFLEGSALEVGMDLVQRFQNC
jgi:4-hydroxy-tetrahydrodipicolinate synthase